MPVARPVVRSTIEQGCTGDRYHLEQLGPGLCGPPEPQNDLKALLYLTHLSVKRRQVLSWNLTLHTSRLANVQAKGDCMQEVVKKWNDAVGRQKQRFGVAL